MSQSVNVVESLLSSSGCYSRTATVSFSSIGRTRGRQSKGRSFSGSESELDLGISLVQPLEAGSAPIHSQFCRSQKDHLSPP